MAMINLDADKIISINNELDSLNKILISNYTPHLKETIGEIRDNVQNEQINSILTTIDSQIDSITNDISTILPKLQGFLASQMESYKKTEEAAMANLDEVVKRMQSFSGMPVTSIQSDVASQITPDTDIPPVAPEPNVTSTQNATTAEPTKENTYDHGWGGKYTETWSSWWGDVQEAYKGTDGLLSFLGNTVEAACDTTGAIIETEGNFLSDGWHILGNIVGWILQ